MLAYWELDIRFDDLQRRLNLADPDGSGMTYTPCAICGDPISFWPDGQKTGASLSCFCEKDIFNALNIGDIPYRWVS